MTDICHINDKWRKSKFLLLLLRSSDRGVGTMLKCGIIYSKIGKHNFILWY